jgi:hypothetical protein
VVVGIDHTGRNLMNFSGEESADLLHSKIPWMLRFPMLMKKI